MRAAETIIAIATAGGLRQSMHVARQLDPADVRSVVEAALVSGAGLGGATGAYLHSTDSSILPLSDARSDLGGEDLAFYSAGGMIAAGLGVAVTGEAAAASHARGGSAWPFIASCALAVGSLGVLGGTLAGAAIGSGSNEPD